MGKGYNNYMCHKFFHPTNSENTKRKWMAEQKAKFDSKREQERVVRYQREQEVLENRALLGDEKARLGLAWMYDQPAVMEPEQKESTNKNEVKFEWQRKFNAPREAYCKNSTNVTDQPFGIEVRNVRCMRCKQWGHLNTDRICPLYGKSFTQEPSGGIPRSLEKAKSGLLKEGLIFKKSAESAGLNEVAYKAKCAVSTNKDIDPEVMEHELTVEFLKSLSEKQREKLLKKLGKLSKGVEGSYSSTQKHKKKKENRLHRH
ncbi:hypothetical protein Aperf_G00000099146 [Anoplocephala perfoliata]